MASINPCEECLVKAMCADPCDDLFNYLLNESADPEQGYYIGEYIIYELRAGILEIKNGAVRRKTDGAAMLYLRS